MVTPARKEYIRLWRLRNKERCRQHYQRWMEKHWKEYYAMNRDSMMKKLKERMDSERGRAIRRKRYRTIKEKSPEKLTARRQAWRKVPASPCVVCGAEAQRHHPDYAKPLEVVFLCRTHHKEVHQS